MPKHTLQLHCHTETGDASTDDDNFLGRVHSAGIDFLAVGVPVLGFRERMARWTRISGASEGKMICGWRELFMFHLDAFKCFHPSLSSPRLSSADGAIQQYNSGVTTSLIILRRLRLHLPGLGVHSVMPRSFRIWGTLALVFWSPPRFGLCNTVNGGCHRPARWHNSNPNRPSCN
jgi:hypothetical protein